MPSLQRRPTGQDDDYTDALGAAIDAMNLAEKASTVAPAKAIFCSVGSVLKMIKVCPLGHR